MTAVAVVGLVAFRLWRLLARDTITDPLRHAIAARMRPDGTGPWATALYWLGCPWCSGWWIAGAVTVVWQLTVGGPLWQVDTLWVWAASSAVPPLGATFTGDAE